MRRWKRLFIAKWIYLMSLIIHSVYHIRDKSEQCKREVCGHISTAIEFFVVVWESLSPYENSTNLESNRICSDLFEFDEYSPNLFKFASVRSSSIFHLPTKNTIFEAGQFQSNRCPICWLTQHNKHIQNIHSKNTLNSWQNTNTNKMWFNSKIAIQFYVIISSITIRSTPLLLYEIIVEHSIPM